MIDRIIARELLGLRSVSLPYVGTLYAHRTPVHRTAAAGDELRLLPAGVEVSLDGSFCDERSIISLVQAYAPELDSEAATLLYNQWVERASSVEAGVLTVEGVCRISTVDFSLSLDPSTTALLHPGRALSLAGIEAPASVGLSASVPLRRAAATPVRWWPAAAVLGAASAYILYAVICDL